MTAREQLKEEVQRLRNAATVQQVKQPQIAEQWRRKASQFQHIAEWSTEDQCAKTLLEALTLNYSAGSVSRG